MPQKVPYQLLYQKILHFIIKFTIGSGENLLLVSLKNHAFFSRIMDSWEYGKGYVVVEKSYVRIRVVNWNTYFSLQG